MSLDVHLLTDDGEVYWANITHNLNSMADAAGLYEAVWRPDEHGYVQAGEIVPTLEAGIQKMKDDPAHFETFNAPNGWGKYEHFLPWLERYLEACQANPDAVIEVSR